MRGRSFLKPVVCVICMIAVPAAMIAAPVWAHSLFVPPTFCSGGGGLVHLAYGSARPSSKASPTSAPRTVKAISTEKEGEPKGERAEESAPPIALVALPRTGFEPFLSSSRALVVVGAPRPLRC